MTKKEQWGLAKVWNESLISNRVERPVVPRSNIWASEVGKANIDIWLKLKGEKPTNPPNSRSLRKFEAGNIWEWIVKLILIRAGILKAEQTWLSYQYPGMLQVTGKLDFLAGGKPDYQQARKALNDAFLPEFIVNAGKGIIEYFEKEYPDGIEPMVLEVKSSSSFMFDSYERTGKSSKNHRLQLVHYLKAKNMKKGILVYICKDDCRMIEVPVVTGGVDEEDYYNSIKELTEYYQSDTMPPLEQAIVYDEDTEKFSKNWHVAYSGYLTKLYGFKTQKEFDDRYQGVTERWNRVLTRIKEGKDLTKNNLEAIEEMKKEGYVTLLDELIKKGREEKLKNEKNEQ